MNSTNPTPENTIISSYLDPKLFEVHLKDILTQCMQEVKMLKNLIKDHDGVDIDLAQKRRFSCQQCMLSFDKPSALGGHVSKCHFLSQPLIPEIFSEDELYEKMENAYDEKTKNTTMIENLESQIAESRSNMCIKL